ncbi:cytochrome c oxidase subunit 2A [Brevibacillus massiliensis]
MSRNVPQFKEKTGSNASLKGTLASVLLVGAFIVVSWFGIFFLFLSRS